LKHRVIPPEQMPPSPRPRSWVTVGRIQSYPHFPGLLLDVRASRPSSLCRIAGGEHIQLVSPLAGCLHPRRQAASLPPPTSGPAGRRAGPAAVPARPGMQATSDPGPPGGRPFIPHCQSSSMWSLQHQA